jgi:hypothetical protein
VWDKTKFTQKKQVGSCVVEDVIDDFASKVRRRVFHRVVVMLLVEDIPYEKCI